MRHCMWPLQVWFVWTYAIFMSAWLLGCHVLPAIPYWRPEWTSPAINVSVARVSQLAVSDCIYTVW